MMIIIKDFKLGEPKTEEQKKLSNQHNVKFLFANDGTEWYECQKNFAENTIKFAFDNNGVIKSIATNKDVSTLWPVDLNVAEIEDSVDNRRADISGGWMYDGIKIIERIYTSEEYKTKAEATRNERIANAGRVISPLQDAFDLDIATDAEVKKLAAWKKYRVLLNRIDVNTAPDIDWPAVPE